MEAPQTLERSVLERKERDELQAIAAALGVKPGSRARKAEIVDLILQHTGVVDEGAAPAPGPARKRAKSGDEPQAGTEESTPDAADRNGDGGAVDARPTGAVDTASEERGSDGGDAEGSRRRITSSGRARKPRPDDEGESAQEPTGAPRSADEPAAEWELAVEGGAEKGAAPDRATADETDRQGRIAAHDEPSAGGGQKGDTRTDRKAGSDVAAEPEGERPKGDKTDGEASRTGAATRDGAAGDQGAEGRDGRSSGKGGDTRTDQRERTEGQGADGQARDGRSEDGAPEPGNRRRRRRGRDRDRHGDRAEEPFTGEPVEVQGLLDLRDEGYGFLRVKGYLPSKEDVYVSVKQARQFGLRKGDHLTGASRPASRNEKNPALLRIDTVNGADPERARARPRFEDLTPLFPDEKLHLEDADDPTNMTARIIDLISPIGKGQRGLIVSPPKAGKTTVMKQIARSIEKNNPEVHLMVLLVDERPEEVTDMRRSVQGEVVASTFDRPSDEHAHVAELTIERAKRLVEQGKDVVIILDGITRLARAYNLAAPATGRIMSGGIDTGALYPPKKFFGAARNIEEGGSLTILATALVETGSRMDEVIFEEFKGTGNMELRLDRKLAERRIYPAIDVEASSTRHEELLFPRNQLQQVWKLRRVLSGLGEGGSAAGLDLLIDRMKTFRSNEEFLAEVAKAPSIA